MILKVSVVMMELDDAGGVGVLWLTVKVVADVGAVDEDGVDAVVVREASLLHAVVGIVLLEVELQGASVLGGGDVPIDRWVVLLDAQSRRDP